METLQNLDQIRARNALEAATGRTFKGAGNGEVVKKIPTMIRENGILGALAFAIENDGKTSHADVFRAIIEHLKTVDRLPKVDVTVQLFMQYLCKEPAATLRAVTAEALAYLNYLRRFARKNNGEG